MYVYDRDLTIHVAGAELTTCLSSSGSTATSIAQDGGTATIDGLTMIGNAYPFDSYDRGFLVYMDGGVTASLSHLGFEDNEGMTGIQIPGSTGETYLLTMIHSDFQNNIVSGTRNDVGVFGGPAGAW